jgi:Fungal protein of unknown function (DUF2011)
MVFGHEEEDLHNSQQDALLPPNESNDEAFKFRLFASKPPTAALVDGNAAQSCGFVRVSIRSPTPVSARGGGGGFVVPDRPWGHYFTTAAGGDDGRRRGEYVEVAVAGEDVLSRARNMAWVRSFRSVPL